MVSSVEGNAGGGLPSGGCRACLGLLRGLRGRRGTRCGNGIHGLVGIPVTRISSSYFVRFKRFVLSLSTSRKHAGCLGVVGLFGRIRAGTCGVHGASAILHCPCTSCTPHGGGGGVGHATLAVRRCGGFITLSIAALPGYNALACRLVRLCGSCYVFLYRVFDHPMSMAYTRSAGVITVGKGGFLDCVPAGGGGGGRSSRSGVICTPVASATVEVVGGCGKRSSRNCVFPFSVGRCG